jgi:hypothetical protein
MEPGSEPAAGWCSDRVAGIVTGGAAALVIVALYAWSFGGRVHILGADQFSYAWQFRAIRAGLLESIDPRPGTLAMGALLQGSGVVPGDLAPTLIAVALLAALGLAVAALLRQALWLPVWAMLPIAIGAATFGGTSRLTGYVANLTSLVCFSAGVAAAVRSEASSWTAYALATMAFLAAGLAHPGILPAWFAIVAGWLGVSVVAWLTGRARHGKAGARPLDLRPVFALAALALGTVGTLVVVLGILHRSLGELGDLELVQGYFGRRLGNTWEWIAPVAPLVIAGLLLAALRGWRRGDPSAQRLLLAWVVACLAGVSVMLVAPGFPGHRTLMLAVPLGAAAGLVAAKIAELAGRALGRVKALAVGGGALLGLAAALVTGSLGLVGFRAAASAPWSDRSLPARQVAAFARVHPADVPVVMVFEPWQAQGALLWKVRLNIARSFLDGRRATQLFMYVGDPERLLAGEPTTLPPGANELGQVLNGISERTWPDVSAAVRDGAVIVFPRAYIHARSWELVLSEGAELVDEDLAVSGGPSHPPEAVPAHASMSPIHAWASASVTILLLGLVGGGYSYLASRDGRRTMADAAALAPAFGTVVIVLVGTTAALAEGDPGGAVGLLALLIMGGAGWVAAVRIRPRA